MATQAIPRVGRALTLACKNQLAWFTALYSSSRSWNFILSRKLLENILFVETKSCDTCDTCNTKRLARRRMKGGVVRLNAPTSCMQQSRDGDSERYVFQVRLTKSATEWKRRGEFSVSASRNFWSRIRRTGRKCTTHVQHRFRIFGAEINNRADIGGNSPSAICSKLIWSAAVKLPLVAQSWFTTTVASWVSHPFVTMTRARYCPRKNRRREIESMGKKKRTHNVLERQKRTLYECIFERNNLKNWYTALIIQTVAKSIGLLSKTVLHMSSKTHNDPILSFRKLRSLILF